MTKNQDRFRDLLYGADGEVIRKGLETSSMSAADAESRARNWDKVFSNLDEIVEDRMYSTHQGAGTPGYSSTGLHGVEFFDATVAAMIKSYSGIFSVERAMEQPNASLPYMNLYGVRTGNLVTPNIGVSQTFTEGDGFMSQEVVIPVANATATFDFATAASTVGFKDLDKLPIVPGSVKISYLEAGKAEIKIVDNGSGDLLAAAGFLKSGSVKYALDNNPSLPEVSFEVANVATANVTVKVSLVYDTPKEINEKIKPELEYYQASTSPIIVPYEINQVANLSARKALGIDMRKLTLTQITDEYTKLINKKTVAQVVASAKKKDEAVIDLHAFTIATSDYRTHLESFMAQLKAVDTAMAKKTEKGVSVSAFLVSLELGNLFQQLDMITTKWVPNKDISYVDDVIGYYTGIPVVRTKWIPEVAGGGVVQGYAIHKTKEGQLAPLMRGIFLPLTNMDEVGSFDNPLLKSGGIFSYEGVSMLTQDLTIGFQVKLGTGTALGQ
jgi:hypothetical protein